MSMIKTWKIGTPNFVSREHAYAYYSGYECDLGSHLLLVLAVDEKISQMEINIGEPEAWEDHVVVADEDGRYHQLHTEGGSK